MRRILAASAFFLACLMSVHCRAANTWGTDFSDLWWNPNESGWGANISHQGEVIFMTMFVYGPDGSTRWYVASGMTSPGGNGTLTFTGALYQTTGPFFGGAFNPANVSVRQVGTATLIFTSIASGTLSYSADGVFVSKAIQRQTFRNNNASGVYIGGLKATATGCSNSGTVGGPATLTISQTGSTATVLLSNGNGGACTISGTYSQLGRMGQLDGTINCTNGAAGSIQAFEIESGWFAFSARYNANYGLGCTETGHFGGVKE